MVGGLSARITGLHTELAVRSNSVGDHFAARLGARLSVIDPLTGELITTTDVLEKVHLEVSSKVDEVGLEEHAGVALNGVDIFCEVVGDCEAGAEGRTSRVVFDGRR